MVVKKITLATRPSPLAKWQTQFVTDLLKTMYPELQVEILEIVTEGDRLALETDRGQGQKEIFVKALQKAVLAGEADVAVHSLKDLSVFPHPELHLSAVSLREDPRDALLTYDGCDWAHLKEGARVGTGSPRRWCQLKALRSDLEVVPLRGNVGTRIARLEKGEFDAIVLAAAGLKRLGFGSRINDYFSDAQMVPAIGQGVIAMECRRADRAIQELLSHVNSPKVYSCIEAERSVNRVLGGDCYTPIGAHAHWNDGLLHLKAVLGSLDGRQLLRAEGQAHPEQAAQLGETVARDLLSQV